MEVYEPSLIIVLMTCTATVTGLVGALKYILLTQKCTYTLEDAKFRKKAIWTTLLLTFTTIMLSVVSYTVLFQLEGLNDVPFFVYLFGAFLGLPSGFSLFLIRHIIKNYL